MKRIVSVLWVVLAMVAATTVPAFAAAGEDGNANCVGETASLGNLEGRTQLGEPAFGGRLVSLDARIQGGVGQDASWNCSERQTPPQ